MYRCLGDLHNYCFVFLDDIIIFSSTVESHLQTRENIFERLKQYNLKLKLSKCYFPKDRAIYLDHIMFSKGIETNPDKIEFVKSWPVPKTIKTVKQFLGFVGFYRPFIKPFSKVLCPLTILL